jgi:type II secretory pathway pseudopilin PulG
MVTRPTTSQRRAFVLIDAIVAAVVLGLALVVVIGLSAEALTSQTRGEQLSTAARLVDEQLNLVLAVGPEAFSSVFDSEGRCEAPFESYTYAVRIESAPLGEAMPVSVTIRWTAGGRERDLTIESRVAPRLGEDPDPERQPTETLGRDSQ